MDAPKESEGNILVVDDEESIRKVILSGLETIGNYTLRQASQGPEALDLHLESNAEVILTDLSMAPGYDGMELLRRVKEQTPLTKVVMITGFDSLENGLESMKQGAYDFIPKPVSISRLAPTVINALNSYHLHKELNEREAQSRHFTKQVDAALSHLRGNVQGMVTGSSELLLMYLGGEGPIDGEIKEQLRLTAERIGTSGLLFDDIVADLQTTFPNPDFAPEKLNLSYYVRSTLEAEVSKGHLNYVPEDRGMDKNVYVFADQKMLIASIRRAIHDYQDKGGHEGFFHSVQREGNMGVYSLWSELKGGPPEDSVFQGRLGQYIMDHVANFHGGKYTPQTTEKGELVKFALPIAE